MSRTVVVTGSTSGIGLAIATAFAETGDNIVINGFGKADEIKAIVERLESLSKGRALYHPADMTKPAEIADLIETAAKTFGGVDVLVNNASASSMSRRSRISRSRNGIRSSRSICRVPFIPCAPRSR